MLDSNRVVRRLEDAHLGGGTTGSGKSGRGQAQGLGRAADDKKKIRAQVSKKMKVRTSKEAYVDIECGYPTTEGGQYPAAVRGDQSTEGGCGEAVPGS